MSKPAFKMVLNACNFGAVQIGHLPHGPAESVNQDYCLPLAFRQVCQCLFKAWFDQGLMPLIPNEQRRSHPCSGLTLPHSEQICGRIVNVPKASPVLPRPGQCLCGRLSTPFDTEHGEKSPAKARLYFSNKVLKFMLIRSLLFDHYLL